METVEKGTRAQVAASLPRLLKKALNSYHRFAEREVPQEPKDFSAHHNACKVAIAHIQLLIKLADWADIKAEIQQNENLSEALTIAHASVSAHEDTDDYDHDENDFHDYDLA